LVNANLAQRQPKSLSIVQILLATNWFCSVGLALQKIAQLAASMTYRKSVILPLLASN